MAPPPDIASLSRTAPPPLAAQSGTTDPTAPRAATPARQVAQSIAVQLGPGTGKLTIQLHPDTLGTVEIRIERPHGAAPLVNLVVEKTDTLHALQQDLPRLHQALERAGIAPDAPVTLQLAPAPAAAAANAGPGLHGQGGSPHPQSQTPSRTARNTAEPEAEPGPDSAPDSWRLGINITA